MGTKLRGLVDTQTCLQEGPKFCALSDKESNQSTGRYKWKLYVSSLMVPTSLATVIFLTPHCVGYSSFGWTLAEPHVTSLIWLVLWSAVKWNLVGLSVCTGLLMHTHLQNQTLRFLLNLLYHFLARFWIWPLGFLRKERLQLALSKW